MTPNDTQAKPIQDVDEILAITYGFMASKALFAALEFDIFTDIAGGADSLPVLVKATGIAENRLVTLLAALKSLGLIAEHEGHFTNAPATARYLVAGQRAISEITLSLSTAPSATRALGISGRRCGASGYSLIRASMRASFMTPGLAASSLARRNTPDLLAQRA